MFITSILRFSWGIRHKTVTAPARLRSSSVIFSKRSLINSGGRAVHMMEVLIASPTSTVPFLPTNIATALTAAVDQLASSGKG